MTFVILSLLGPALCTLCSPFFTALIIIELPATYFLLPWKKKKLSMWSRAVSRPGYNTDTDTSLRLLPFSFGAQIWRLRSLVNLRVIVSLSIYTCSSYSLSILLHLFVVACIDHGIDCRKSRTYRSCTAHTPSRFAYHQLKSVPNLNQPRQESIMCSSCRVCHGDSLIVIDRTRGRLIEVVNSLFELNVTEEELAPSTFHCHHCVVHHYNVGKFLKHQPLLLFL